MRGNLVPDSDLYKELNELRKDNDKLRDLLNKSNAVQIDNIAGLSDAVEITIKYSLSDRLGPFNASIEGEKLEKSLTITWGHLFSIVAPKLLVHLRESAVNKLLTKYLIILNYTTKKLHDYEIIDSDVEIIRTQLRALDLINLTPVEIATRYGHDKALEWSLTPKGENIMLIERSLKKQDGES